MNRRSRPHSLLFLIGALALIACGGDPAETDCLPCSSVEPVPFSGFATLSARTTHDYDAATISFEHASVRDSERVLNDWDLLFGNDQHEDRDLFSVNTVTDDRSFIVDLGEITFDVVPEEVDPGAHPVGEHGEHDAIPVVANHLYVVRTLDSDTSQWAAFRVIEHELNRSVSIFWVRSPEAERFVLPEL